VTNTDKAFIEFVMQEDFPCLGARATVNQDAHTVKTFGSLGENSNTERLAEALSCFGEGLASSDQLQFKSFIAVFPESAPSTEIEFDERLWVQLQLLHVHERVESTWASGTSDNPDDAGFSFSFEGVAYFVVGLSPVSSRRARRFSFPALVFNPHLIFDRLRGEGKFERMKGMIRQRDARFDGMPNPNLADFGEQSEARQYSGMVHSAEWKCPFHRES